MAIAQYSRAIEVNAQFDRAYTGRALVYCLHLQDLYDEALFDFTKSIELNSQNPVTYHGRGMIYYMKGFYDLALPDFTKVIELKPAWGAGLYLSRANIYIQLRRFLDADKDLSTAIELNEENAQAYCNRAVVRYFLEQYLYARLDVDCSRRLGVDIGSCICNEEFLCWLEAGCPDGQVTVADEKKDQVETDSLKEAITIQGIHAEESIDEIFVVKETAVVAADEALLKKEAAMIETASIVETASEVTEEAMDGIGEVETQKKSAVDEEEVVTEVLAQKESQFGGKTIATEDAFEEVSAVKEISVAEATEETAEMVKEEQAIGKTPLVDAAPVLEYAPMAEVVYEDTTDADVAEANIEETTILATEESTVAEAAAVKEGIELGTAETEADTPIAEIIADGEMQSSVQTIMAEAVSMGILAVEHEATVSETLLMEEAAAEETAESETFEDVLLLEAASVEEVSTLAEEAVFEEVVEEKIDTGVAEAAVTEQDVQSKVAVFQEGASATGIIAEEEPRDTAEIEAAKTVIGQTEAAGEEVTATEAAVTEQAAELDAAVVELSDIMVVLQAIADEVFIEDKAAELDMESQSEADFDNEEMPLVEICSAYEVQAVVAVEEIVQGTVESAAADYQAPVEAFKRDFGGLKERILIESASADVEPAALDIVSEGPIALTVETDFEEAALDVEGSVGGASMREEIATIEAASHLEAVVTEEAVPIAEVLFLKESERAFQESLEEEVVEAEIAVPHDEAVVSIVCESGQDVEVRVSVSPMELCKSVETRVADDSNGKKVDALAELFIKVSQTSRKAANKPAIPVPELNVNKALEQTPRRDKGSVIDFPAAIKALKSAGIL